MLRPCMPAKRLHGKISPPYAPIATMPMPGATSHWRRILPRFRLTSRAFEDDPRAGTPEALAKLRAMGLHLRILSGDAKSVVRRIADRLGIDEAIGGMSPKEKTDHVAGLGKALMVGDGLNDAPALARAHASMAPASAADIGRNAADFVFLHGSLTAVPLAISIARDAKRLVGQNFTLAIGYNVLALPFAIAGYVTPLLAALAMSASSIVVVANALRLRRGRG